MAFAQEIERLRQAAYNRQEGVPEEKCYVWRRDLRELLFHFDRLDSEARNRYMPAPPGAGAEVEYHEDTSPYPGPGCYKCTGCGASATWEDRLIHKPECPLCTAGAEEESSDAR